MSKYTIAVNGTEHEVTLLRKEGCSLAFEVEGTAYDVEIRPKQPVVVTSGQSVQPASPQPQKSKPSVQSNSSDVHAPMPGIVVSVEVKEGDTVSAGQNLMVIEAMKMENNIQSPRDGKVKSIHVNPGQEIDNQELLLSFE